MVIAIAAAGIAVSAGVGLYSSSQQADAAEDAAQLQQESADQGIALQREMYQQTRKDLAPWRSAGGAALKDLRRQMEPGGYLRKPFEFDRKDFRADPGYQFRVAQGQKALERSAAAGGTLLSGSTLKAAERFGQNIASDEYSRAYGRAFGEHQYNTSNRFNRLASLAGIGQQATNMGIQAGQQYGQSATDLITGAGNAAAAGQIGSANAWAQGAQGVGNALNSGLSNYFMLSQMNQPNYAPAYTSAGPQSQYYQGGYTMPY